MRGHLYDGEALNALRVTGSGHPLLHDVGNIIFRYAVIVIREERELFGSGCWRAMAEKLDREGEHSAPAGSGGFPLFSKWS